MHGCYRMVSSRDNCCSGAMMVASVRLRESRSPCDDCCLGDKGSSSDCCCHDGCSCASRKGSLARVGKKSLARVGEKSLSRRSLSRGVFCVESLEKKELLALAGFRELSAKDCHWLSALRMVS